MRVASLRDTLTGKLLAWQDKSRRPSKGQKDFTAVPQPEEPEVLKGLLQREGVEI